MNEVKVRMLKMEPIKVRCKSCGKEIRAAAGKSVCCGCSNMTTIKGDVISAVDLSKVIMLNTYTTNKDTEEMEFGDANVIPTACIKSMRKIK